MADLFNQIEELNFQIHKRETNPESESYLEAGRKAFSKNCKTLFNLFMSGERITSNNSPVGDFRRRICDLKENGVKLHFDTNGRIKTWYMDSGDRLLNQHFIEIPANSSEFKP